MKIRIIKIGKIAIRLGPQNKYLHPIGVGGGGEKNSWSARHWFWRFYKVQKKRRVGFV
jgi:hypothetical protein